MNPGVRPLSWPPSTKSPCPRRRVRADESDLVIGCQLQGCGERLGRLAEFEQADDHLNSFGPIFLKIFAVRPGGVRDGKQQQGDVLTLFLDVALQADPFIVEVDVAGNLDVEGVARAGPSPFLAAFRA